ncbi:MAG: COX15/CtaA family protein [Pseudomonadota bacterium]|nr:COX15/CtaA family protein [Pseudomonadota bacterium]
MAFVAALVFAMIVVGGATRLTDSGLSITEWRPITGAVPPLTDSGWAAEFQKYRRIPEYRHVNAGMSLGEFQAIYWWEWGHRFLGRIIGLAYALPFAAFLLLRRMPPRLVARGWLLLALGALQGLVGWWMVASGLSNRVDVLPERLTAHLGLALFLFAALVWTALDAWAGEPRARTSKGGGLATAAAGLLGLVFLQCLLGGLVAGNRAGRIYTDWPLFNGEWLPSDYGAAGGLWPTLAHDLAAVQLHHRLGAYLLLAAVWIFAVHVFRRRSAGPVRAGAALLAALVTGQAALGVATLMNASPMGLGIAHQAGAVLVLGGAVILVWTAGAGARRRDQASATGWTPGLVSSN